MPEKDTISNQQMAADYGFALAFINSDSELKSLFRRAVKNTWDVNMFTARLRATKWFRHHSASVRNAIMQKTSDPATYRENLNKMRAQVNDVWGKAYGKGAISQRQLNAWAETAYRMGWSEEQLLDRMGAGLKFQTLMKQKKLGGTAAETSQQIDQLARQYGVWVGAGWKAQQLKRVMIGNDTANGIEYRIKEMAKARYKAFADRIEAGQTVMEIADPYVQQMADLLELNPGEVDIKSSMIQRALTARNQDGVSIPMDLNDFADTVRKDARWQYTDNAREQAVNMTSNILRSFGLA